MAKNYGDLALMKDEGGIKHITVSGIECLCGCKWRYGVINRNGKSQNIIYRSIDDVTCDKCKELYYRQDSL